MIADKGAAIPRAFVSFVAPGAIACPSLLEQGFEAQGEDGHAEGSNEGEGEQDEYVVKTHPESATHEEQGPRA